MLKAPPVYRPCPARELLVQAKKLTVGSPPVYRPCPPREAVQLRQATVSRINIIQRSKSSNTDDLETAQHNLKILKGYRSSPMKKLVRQYGNESNLLAALQEWGGGIIPGHLSGKSDNNSGEQPGTTLGCNNAIKFLQSYLKEHKSISTDNTESDNTETNNNNNLYNPNLSISKKEEKKQKKVTRQEEWMINNCEHDFFYGYCKKCSLKDPNYQDPYENL